MLKLTKKADYGLIALKHLAVNADSGSASAKEIAETYGVPLPLLSKVLQLLTRSGIVRSEQGTRGGYRLARDARDINTLEVIRAIDGPIILTHCFTDHSGCDLHDSCNVRQPLRKLHEGILGLLQGLSIWDLSQDEPGTSAPLPGGAALFSIKPSALASGPPGGASK